MTGIFTIYMRLLQNYPLLDVLCRLRDTKAHKVESSSAEAWLSTKETNGKTSDAQSASGPYRVLDSEEE